MISCRFIHYRDVVALAVASSVALMGCSGDSIAGPVHCDPVDGGSPWAATFGARVDGAAFCATTIANVSLLSSNRLEISATTDELGLKIIVPMVAGTFDLDPGQPSGTYWRIKDVTTLFTSAGDGRITITMASPTRVTGTFEFVADGYDYTNWRAGAGPPEPTGERVHVREGTFDLMLLRVPAPAIR